MQRKVLQLDSEMVNMVGDKCWKICGGKPVVDQSSLAENNVVPDDNMHGML